MPVKGSGWAIGMDLVGLMFEGNDCSVEIILVPVGDGWIDSLLVG